MSHADQAATAAPAASPSLKTIPATIGAPFEGGIYAGIARGQNGQPDEHLILLPGDEKLNWDAAVAFAAAAGGRLPTRREQSLLFANLKEEFKEAWYWSGEQHEVDTDYAWYQYFYDGSQDTLRKSVAGRARAVRSIAI
ncbi:MULTISPECIES: DUF1566 domain-containing protein [unclassified Duganella]|uniref:DUF1566 domain-containing protein n=1 Tax=unclassified Duganella TaxID=2636909 RepID=UPI00088BA994|nr:MULTISPECIES: DUF1566 domain-containing protein [unclassified Duganella]SDH41548.1 Protein of unknown function [Duganella sp. OV458]SDK60795.1 Protein of unknown function [Duganella sp. OV510]